MRKAVTVELSAISKIKKALLNFKWVDSKEVEFADDQEDNGPDRGDTSEATGAALDCHFSNQGIQIGCTSGFEIVPVLERGPAHPFALERVVHLCSILRILSTAALAWPMV